MDKKGKPVDADKEKSLNGARHDHSPHSDEDECVKDERRKSERRNIERRSGDDRRVQTRRASDLQGDSGGAQADARVRLLSDEIKERDGEVDRLKKEIDSFKDLLQRRQADFENYKKRTLKYQEEQKKYALKDLAYEIIQINDDLIRALEAALQVDTQGGESHKSFVDGVGMISRRIEETLQKFGIVEIEAISLPFNPNYHEAVEIEMSKDYNVDTVVKVYQKGFRIDDMVIRSTKVKVAKAAAQVAGDKNDKENGGVPGSC